MRKLLKLFLISLICLGFLATPASAIMRDMWAKVYSWDGQMNADGRMVLAEISSGVMYVVMMADSVATPETLFYYNNDAYTSLANPVTGTNFADDAISGDKVAFRVDPSETNDVSVDLIVVDQAGGYTAFIEDFNENIHSVIIDERIGVRHHGVAFIVTTTSSTEVDTGIDFDDASIIDKMIIEVGTAFPTNTAISVGILSTGTNGDYNGFIEAEGLGTAGYNNPMRSGVDLTSYSATSGEQYGIINLGAAGTFLGHLGAGTGDTETLTPAGMILADQLLIHGTWEPSLSYTLPVIAANTGWGLIHYWFTRIR